jgi:hypothetical protein
VGKRKIAKLLERDGLAASVSSYAGKSVTA